MGTRSDRARGSARQAGRHIKRVCHPKIELPRWRLARRFVRAGRRHGLRLRGCRLPGRPTASEGAYSPAAGCGPGRCGENHWGSSVRFLSRTQWSIGKCCNDDRTGERAAGSANFIQRLADARGGTDVIRMRRHRQGAKAALLRQKIIICPFLEVVAWHDPEARTGWSARRRFDRGG